MAEEKSFQEKTEEPSQKRLDDAREEGNIPRSAELSSAMVLLAGITSLYFLGSSMWNSMGATGRFLFIHAPEIELTRSNLPVFAEEAVLFMIKLMAPIALLVLVVGLLTGIGQAGANFTLKPLMPKGSKMNPIKGAKQKFFSARAFVELVKSVLKVLVVAGFAWWTISGMFSDYIPLLDKEIGQIFIYLMTQTFKLSIRIALLLLAMAVLDYIWQRYQHRKKLMMSRQEVKDERKQQEGDPMIKNRIRSIQMETARKRMMQDVKEADVVVTNPVHLAVALKYDVVSMRAPVVVAKGARLVAEKIKEIARAHDIPVIENKPLARALFKAVDVGGEVPADLYKAVAQVLAYVYRLKKKRIA